MLDVRTVAEWSAGHVPGATNIPLGELQSRVGELSRDRHGQIALGRLDLGLNALLARARGAEPPAGAAV